MERPTNYDWHDAENLRQLYHEKGMTLQDIANSVGVSKGAVQYWMNKHDIETRARGQPSTAPSDEELLSEYVFADKSQRDVATEYDVTANTIRTWLKQKFGTSNKGVLRLKYDN